MQYTESQLTDMVKVIRNMGNTTYGVMTKHTLRFFNDNYSEVVTPEDAIARANAIDLNDEAAIKEASGNYSLLCAEMGEEGANKRLDFLASLLPRALIQGREELYSVKAFLIRLIERYIAE